MYKIYSGFILILIAVIYFMADKEKPESSILKEPSNVLPLTLINLGDKCIIPSKLETDSWMNGSKLVRKGITFLAEIEGDQVFMCRIEKPSGQTIHSKSSLLPNDKNCTYPIKFKEMDPLKCFHEPEPVVQKLDMKMGPVEINYVPCGPDKRGKMYRFVYEVCMTENEIENEKSPNFCNLEGNTIKYRSEFELYRFCYDERRKTVIHTEHKILSPALLSNRKLKREQEKTYDLMIDNGNYFGLDEEALKSKYEYVKLETKMEQKSSSSNQIQDLNHSNNNVQIFSNNQYQKLVPPGDFAFALWKKPAYHYVNLKLMRKDLMKLWDHINKRIRNDAIKRNREYYIHTGAYEKTTDQIGNHRNTKNKKSQENTDYWLKIIYYFRGRLKGQNEPIKNTAVAIVMNNNFDNNSSTDSWFDEKCEKNLCENAFVEQFQQIGKSVRCCSLINTQTFNETDLKIDEDLEVDFLYEDYNA